MFSVLRCASLVVLIRVFIVFSVFGSVLGVGWYVSMVRVERVS